MFSRSAHPWLRRGGVVIGLAATAQLALMIAISGGALADGVAGRLLARFDLAPAVVVATAAFLLTLPWVGADPDDHARSRRGWWFRAALPIWLGWWLAIPYAVAALHLHGKGRLLQTALWFRPVGTPVEGLSVGALLLTVALTALLAPFVPAVRRRLGTHAYALPVLLVVVGLAVRIIAVAAGADALWGILSWPPAHLHLVGVGMAAAVFASGERRARTRRIRVGAAAVALLAFVLGAFALGLPRSPLLTSQLDWLVHAVLAVVVAGGILVAVFGAGPASWRDTPRRTVATLAVAAPGVLLVGESTFLLVARQYHERVVVLPGGGVLLPGNLVAPFVWSLLTAAMFGVVVTAVVGLVFHWRDTRRLPAASSPLAFASLVALGWFVRVGTLLTVAPEKTDLGDPLFYHTTANLLARGRGFPEPLHWIAYGVQKPSAFHGPLYPIALSVSSRFGGTTYFDHKMLSIVIGTVLVAMVGLVAREVAGHREALVATFLAAVYPNLWLVDGLLYPETLMALLTTCAIFVAYRWRARGTRWLAALLGAIIALAALARGEAIMLLPLLAVPWIWLRRDLARRERVTQIVVAGVACLAVLAPWMIRNARSFEEFVPLSTNGNEVMVYANCDTAYNGQFVGYWDYQCQQRIRDAGEGPDDTVLDESQTANFWKQIGVDYAKDHTEELPRVVTLRVLRQWELFRPMQNVRLAGIEGRDVDASTAGLLMYYAMAALSVVGLVALRRRKVGIWPFVVMFVSVTVTAAYTYGNIRFRAPVEPVLCILAAVGAVPVWTRLRRWVARRHDDAPDHDPAAFVAGGRGGLRVRAGGQWRRPALLNWAGIGAVLAIVAIPLRGLYHTTGGTMEEAFMIVFPERMWKGDLPNVDFLHLYGPGALHVLMGWFKVFGYSLESERTFGLLQHLGIIFGLYALARPWGRIAAAAVAGLSVFYILTPIGLTAMAWNGGLALVLWSVVFALRARHVARPRTCLVTAGVLAGLALTYRPDLGLALVLVYAWYLWRNPHWRPVVVGALVGLVPMWVHIALVGPSTAFRGMFLDPVFHLRAGRELPRPPSWGHLDGSLQAIAELIPPWWGVPHLPASNAIFLWFFAMLAAPVAIIVVARRTARTRPRSPEALTLMAVGLVSLGIVPQALQRPDSTHLSWVTCIAFPFLVVAVAQAVRNRNRATGPHQRAVIGAVAVVVLTLVVAPLFTFRYYLLHSRVSIGNVQTPFPVERNERRFYLGDYGPYLASKAAIEDLARLSKPGESLIVGPEDLRRTWYSDSFFYYLFPELTPGTFFIEMDPGLANAEDSPLADELRRTDWVILTGFWNGWREPNSSMDYGSDEPNKVIEDDFCLVGDYEDGLVKLYHRCDA